jgi:hypothetical protein
MASNERVVMNRNNVAILRRYPTVRVKGLNRNATDFPSTNRNIATFDFCESDFRNRVKLGVKVKLSLCFN